MRSLVLSPPVPAKEMRLKASPQPGGLLHPYSVHGGGKPVSHSFLVGRECPQLAPGQGLSEARNTSNIWEPFPTYTRLAS